MAAVCLGLVLKLAKLHYVPSDGSNPVTVERLFDCGVLCGLNKNCVSVVFNTGTRECIQRRRWATEVDARLYPVNTSVMVFNTPRNSQCPMDQGYSLNTNLMICYKVHETKKSQPEATSICVREGADRLMRIDTSQKGQFFIQELQPHDALFVDGKLSSGGWVYGDGTPMTYLPFYPEDPSGDGSCLEFKEALNDLPCYFERTFICEKQTDFQ